MNTIKQVLFSSVDSWELFHEIFISVDSHDKGRVSTDSIFHLCAGAVYGTVVAGCTEIIPRHVAQYVRRQGQGGAFLSFLLLGNIEFHGGLKEAKVKKMMSTKLNMAKFLRDSIAESGMNSKETSAAQEFASFFKKVGGFWLG